MANAATVVHRQDWLAKGVSRTRWLALTINTTGDVGSAQDAYNLQGSIEILVTSTGSIGSLGVLTLEESMDATTWTTALTTCGTALSFDSATAVGLSTGINYHVQPGALYYRPHWTAGASGVDIADVHLIQRA